MTKHPIYLLVSREDAKRIVDWYEMIDAVKVSTNDDTKLAASIERAIEQHDEEMERQASYAKREKAKR
jgi:predicted ATP-grasp superfamily ATP-dependent carboligase